MGFLAALEARKSLLPLILGGLVGLALVVGAIVLFEKGKTVARAEQAKAVLEAQRKADQLSARLVAEQAAYLQQLDAASQTTRERIVRVPVTTVCRDSPAIGAALDGVQQLLGGGGAAPR